MKPEKHKTRYIAGKVDALIKSIELEIVENTDIVFLNQSLANRGITTGKWGLIKQKHADNLPLIETMRRIETILEGRIVNGALNNKLNTTMAIFVLKNKYHWRDSKVIDNNITVKPILAGLSNSQDKIIDATPVDEK